jgi:hypothetical protein
MRSLPRRARQAGREAGEQHAREQQVSVHCRAEDPIATITPFLTGHGRAPRPRGRRPCAEQRSLDQQAQGVPQVRGGLLDGASGAATCAWSQAPRTAPAPVRPITTCRGVRGFTARRTLERHCGERTSTSPGAPSPSSWRENTVSKPKSLPIAVRLELLVVSATAGRPGRSTR